MPSLKELPLDVFDDPTPAAYPEQDGEGFEFMYGLGIRPGELALPEEDEAFARWIALNHPVQSVAKAAPSFSQVLKANPYHDAGGKFSTKENDADGVWKKTSGNLGSNPGGVFEKDGKKHYVKFPNAKGQIAAEEAADKLYELVGVGTMNHKATEVGGKLASVSEWKEVKQLGKDGWKNLSEEQVETAARAFMASALTMNWDVVGLAHDNMGTDKSGKLHIMDTGGSFQYRAQGEPKKFTGDPTSEIDGMLNPEKTSGRVFAPLMKSHPQAFARAAQAIGKLTDEQLIDAVRGVEANSPGTGKAIIERRNAISKRFPLTT